MGFLAGTNRVNADVSCARGRLIMIANSNKFGRDRRFHDSQLAEVFRKCCIDSSRMAFDKKKIATIPRFKGIVPCSSER